jgi:hypothetical protein
MRSPLGTKIITAALAVKRCLAVRTRLTWLGWRLWQHRLGIRPLHNLLEDRKWGGFCGGTKPSPYAHLGASVTQSLDYGHLSYLFTRNNLPVHESDVLVDVGCGKGRVINFWLGRGFRNRIIGIEIDGEIADTTRNRLARYPNVEIITGDATELLPEDGTLFFLFNPFGPDVMRRFLERLKQRRNTRIIYYYCLYIDLFKNDGFWTVEDLRTGDWKRAVLIRPKAAVLAQREGGTAGSGARGAGRDDPGHRPVAAHARAAG